MRGRCAEATHASETLRCHCGRADCAQSWNSSSSNRGSASIKMIQYRAVIISAYSWTFTVTVRDMMHRYARWKALEYDLLCAIAFCRYNLHAIVYRSPSHDVVRSSVAEAAFELAAHRPVALMPCGQCASSRPRYLYGVTLCVLSLLRSLVAYAGTWVDDDRCGDWGG